MFIVMWLLNFNAVARLVGLQGLHFRLLVATTNHAEKDIRPQLRLQNLLLRRMILLEAESYFKAKGEYDTLFFTTTFLGRSSPSSLLGNFM